MDNFSLKSKKLLLAAWACEVKDSFIYTNWYLTLKELFGETILFDPRKNYFTYGKETMNKKFLELIKQEQPDYIIFCLTYDEFDLDFFTEIRKTSPKTLLINLFSDDEWNFDNYSRYYALFFDYLITVKKDLSDYNGDGIKNVHFLYGVSEKEYKPQNLEKKYDVSFIGSSIRDRPDFLKYLIKNGINVTIAGSSEWEKYPELKNNYIGFLNNEDFFKTINQSKINLVFSKTALSGKGKMDSHLKLRVFEFAACKSFGLIESTPGLVGIFKNKKINFKTKEELLEKIKYFLSHEEEREKMANLSYNYFLKHFTLRQKFKEFFKKISATVPKKPDFLPRINKKIITLSKQDFNLSVEKLKEKLEKIDYIMFNNGGAVFSSYKEYFQVYSLEKSKKPISCCDYYVNSKALGNFLVFRANLAFRYVPKEASHFITINQLMVTKDYFITNFDLIKKTFFGKEIEMINSLNTVFVSIPLFKTKKLKVSDYETMNKAFIMKFKDKLFSLFSQKKFFNFYPLALLFSSINGKNFILRYIKEMVLNKENQSKIKEYS
jgi:spore maturation protein CgeB